jgi:hypothetical protein
LNPERVRQLANALSVFDLILFANPRLSLMLQPWA